MDNVAGRAIAGVAHATTVAIGSNGVLILGPSGSGKSALALQLMAYGACLVADDRTELTATPATLIATCPAAGRGLIEARGLGILRATCVDEVAIVLVVDMGQHEPDRLPPQRRITLHGHDIALVHGASNAHFPAALWCYVTQGRQA